jgi:hypothetical protein
MVRSLASSERASTPGSRDMPAGSLTASPTA